jgi:hypothetical protein
MQSGFLGAPLSLALLFLGTLSACGTPQSGNDSVPNPGTVGSSSPSTRTVSSIANPNNLLAATWGYGNWSSRTANTRSVPTTEDGDGFLDSLTASTYGWTGTQFTVATNDIVNSSVYMAVPTGSPSIMVRVAIQNTSGTEFPGSGVGGLNGQLFTVTSTPQRFAPPAWSSTVTGTVQIAITGINPGKTLQIGGVRVAGAVAWDDPGAFSQVVMNIDPNTQIGSSSLSTNIPFGPGPFINPALTTSSLPDPATLANGSLSFGPTWLNKTGLLAASDPTTKRFQRVLDPLGSGKYMYKTLIVSGDKWVTSNGTPYNYPRVDMGTDNVLALWDKEYLFTARYIWTGQTALGTSNTMVTGFQMHHENDQDPASCNGNHSPPLASYIEGSQWILSLNVDCFAGPTKRIKYVLANPLQANTEYRIRMEIKPSQTTNGYLKLWINGIQQTTYTGIVGFVGSSYLYAGYWIPMSDYDYDNRITSSHSLFVGPRISVSRKP